MLSKYFSLAELTKSSYAARLGIDNVPTGQNLINLKAAALKMDEVRKLLGKPIYISSGYRCPEVNAAVGGSKTSTHLTGEAFDFTCPEFGTVDRVFEAIRKSPLRYDQLLNEYQQWCHIGFGKQLRHQQLNVKRINGKTVYEVAK